MALKTPIREVCQKCGAIDARIEGDHVRYGLHDCPAPKPDGPPRPKWAGFVPLTSIYFIPKQPVT